MGLCRGLNLLLGISILPEVLLQYWFLGLVPVLYIAAITMVSRGEVHGGRKSTMYGAAVLYGIVVVSILAVAFINQHFIYALFFLGLLVFLIFPPLKKALQNPVGPVIGKAVKAGVIALIAMNAAWAAAFGHLYLALLILLLLPLSLWLAKQFAVT
jgi:4-hydroxybenzoate polyprenyltransferase